MAKVVKMSAKLVVHKFEKGVNFKSLHISFKHDENESPETTFGSWVEGKVEHKGKNMEKSRLVVKVISEECSDDLRLDMCAYETKDINTFLKAFQNANSVENFSNDNNGTNKVKDKCDRDKNDECSQFQCYAKENDNFKSQNTFFSQMQTDMLNPLEYRIEKVKESNAKIMENIHMLNRTLNYTKKKEILEMINPKPLHSYPCNECGKCFVYETGLRRHFFIRHGSIDTQPRWQTVWTCAECFQVWPCQDVALKHSSQCCRVSNNKIRELKTSLLRQCELCEKIRQDVGLMYSCQCCQNNNNFIREIKTSLLLQCEFCEKVFTSIPRLLQHSKLHTVESNYECSSCSIAFPSYKNAEHHWLVCPWLLLNYKFSLPKMLLCNACDRKFRNYDQLYNHRYKAGHFMGKTFDDPNSKNVAMLVYQCEECSQWFQETTALESHRNQYHPPCFNVGLLSNFDMSTTADTF